MASFCAVLFPTRCLDEIWDLIESVSEGFPTYLYLSSLGLFDSYPANAGGAYRCQK